jgi:hypothetical protein
MPVRSWDRFWYREGGRLSVAVVRVAIAIAALWTLWRLGVRDYAQLLPTKPAELYRAKGLLLLWRGGAPPASVLTVVQAVAWAATVSMLVGLLSRACAALSLVAVWTVVAFEFSYSASWSHQYNIVILAQIAFLGARGGDTLSLDAWIRQRRGLAPVHVANGYVWSLRLVQFAVALPFANAAVIKLASAGFTLRWAFSDNLRHQILVGFDWTGTARTPLAEWLVQGPVRYQAAAALNLVAQLTPIAGFALMEKPRLRALSGLLFAVEVVALGLVMGLWNLHWLPVCAAFIDWDRLLGKHTMPGPALSRPVKAAASAFVGLFVFYDLVVSFSYPRIDTRLGTYPFSAFPMFSKVRAKPPYRVHQSYEFLGARLNIDAMPPLGKEQLAWLNRRYRFLHMVQEPQTLRVKLAEVLRTAAGRYRQHRISGVEVELVIFQAPAYPAPARLIEHPVAVIGALQGPDEFRSLVGSRVGKGRIQLEAIGLERSAISQFVHYRDEIPAPAPLAVRQAGPVLEFEVPWARAVLVTAQVADRRYLVGRSPPIGW